MSEWIKKKKAEEDLPETYSQEEMEIVENHIEAYFGEFAGVMHEIFSPDIHVDICMIEPMPGRDYYTLVTMGMGAHFMNVPKELKKHKLERAELVITLPPDWNINGKEETDYWPIRWLKILARLPIEEDSWLGWGHTIDNPDTEPFAENTGFTGMMLLSDVNSEEEEAYICEMPDGSEINFYDMIPLYPEEMKYKIEHGHRAEALLELFEKEEIQLRPMNLKRKNVCE